MWGRPCLVCHVRSNLRVVGGDLLLQEVQVHQVLRQHKALMRPHMSLQGLLQQRLFGTQAPAR